MKPRHILVVHYQPHSVLGQMRRLIKQHGLSARYVARDKLTDRDIRTGGQPARVWVSPSSA